MQAHETATRINPDYAEAYMSLRHAVSTNQFSPFPSQQTV